jgi:uncharacterized membrane protein
MEHAERTGHAHERHPAGPVEYRRDVESVAFFSDAVFAIAMTLLIIGVRVPSGTTANTLGDALRGLGPSFASYGISFIVIGLHWLGYHRQVHVMDHLDGGALFITLLFLMSVAFLPFPTLLLNNDFGPVAVIFYAASMAVTGLLLAALWLYAGRRGLLRDVDARLDRYNTVRAIYAPLIFLLSIPVAVAAPTAATYMWILVFVGRPILRRVAYR